MFLVSLKSWDGASWEVNSSLSFESVSLYQWYVWCGRREEEWVLFV